ncbi:MAG TPA: hypothetical protein DCP69_04875 [Candidatus Omnitrophica bacterium]|nr:hypothetical protein [Candidatus Omnitrophota bacterium]
MRDWWKDAGQTSTSTVGFITEEELASCAITAAKIANLAVTADKLSTDSVTTDKMTDATVTSCKLSDNALYRTVAIPFPKLTACFAQNLTSDYILYQPIVPINIQSVRIVNMAAWENATDDNVILFRNSSSCIALVERSSSTAWALGTQSCAAATINNPLVAANTLITMKTIFTTCSVSSAGYVVIHYKSTG